MEEGSRVCPEQEVGGTGKVGHCMSLDHPPDLERDPVVEGEHGVKG